MPEFKYTASDTDGVINSNTIIADNEEEVLITLRRENLTLINLQELEEAKVTFVDKVFNRVSNDDKGQFLEYFASMLEAGLSVSDVLQAFYEDLDKPQLRLFVKNTQYGIRNGKQLSECFADHPDLFPPLYTGMVKVGEASGTLAQSLRQLAEQIDKSNKLKSKVRNSMIYPAVLMFALVAIVIILLVVVFPRLEEFFVDAGLELPPLTAFLLALSQALTRYWFIVTALLVGGIYAYRRAMKSSPQFKMFMGRLFLRIPIFGGINKTTNVALFTRTFGSLLSSGVNVLEAADVVRESLTNPVYKSIIDVMKEDLSKGNTIADTMKKYPKYFSPFEIRVLYISDRTGTLSKGLGNVAVFYEEKLFSMLAGLSTAIEPIILLVMGVVVAVIAVAVITPIYQLLSGVEGV